MTTVSKAARASRTSSDNDENMIASYNTQDDLETSPVNARTRRSVSIARNNLIVNIIIQSIICVLVFCSVMFEDWFDLRDTTIGLLFIHRKGDSYFLFKYAKNPICEHKFNFSSTDCERIVWFSVGGFIGLLLLVIGLLLNVYSILHLINAIYMYRIKVFRKSGMMAIMCLAYGAGIGAWITISTAIVEILNTRMSFYITASVTLLAILSTWYYYSALANIEKKRLVGKLINDTD